MPAPTEHQEDGGGQEPALGVGSYDHLDPEPRLVPTYLALFVVAACIGLVAWLGWGWEAVVLTVLFAALVVGVLRFRNERGRGAGALRGEGPGSAYDDARTETVEHQTRMRLDSKGPLGF